MFNAIGKKYGYTPPKSKGAKKQIASAPSSGTIDPVTGQPYSFLNNSGKVNADQFPWVMQGQSTFTQNSMDGDQGKDAFGAFDTPDYDPAWLKSLGYGDGKESPFKWQGSYDSGTMAVDPAFTQWLKDQGLTLGMSQMKGGGSHGQDLLRMQAFRNGQPVGTEHRWTKDERDPAFGAAMALGAAFGGNFGLAAGALGGAAGAGGLDSAASAALAGQSAPGAGLAAAEGVAAGAPSTLLPAGVTGVGNLAGANAALLNPSDYAGLSSGVSPTPTGAADAAFAGGGVTPVQPGEYGELGTGTAGYSSPSNPALIESSIGTPGYGTSSSGAGGGAVGIAGSSVMDMLNSGDIAGAVKAGGAGVLSFLGSPQGLNLLGGIANGLIGNNAASDALKAQQKAAADALALQKYMYDTTRGDQATYRATGEVGATGMRNLLADPSGITKDPSYAFGLTQGQKSIDQSAASRGGLYSGATLKALQRYGQDYGSTKLNDAYSRYGDAARLGEAATANVAAVGANYSNHASDTITGAGNASGAASLYKGNNWMDTINNGLASLNRSTYQPATPGP